MCAEEYLKKDKALRKEADDMLHEKGLRSLLEELGRLRVGGSYALQLMTWRDLDLYLHAPEITNSQFLELGRQVEERLHPWK
ncbi:MAG: hypothetical protein ACYSYT_06435, partial [Planctomycetota bacterium]